jgi:hypothetical protein
MGTYKRAGCQLPSTPEGTGISSWELALEYKLTDDDGRRPRLGKADDRFLGVPPSLVDVIRTGTQLQMVWPITLAKRTRQFARQSRSDRLPAFRTGGRQPLAAGLIGDVALTFYVSDLMLRLECLWKTESNCSKEPSIS